MSRIDLTTLPSDPKLAADRWRDYAGECERDSQRWYENWAQTNDQLRDATAKLKLLTNVEERAKRRLARRVAVHRQVMELRVRNWLWYSGIAVVGTPLATALVAAAWRFGIWVVAG